VSERNTFEHCSPHASAWTPGVNTVINVLISVDVNAHFALSFLEPNGGEQSVISYHYHIPLVSELFHHIIFKQEGFVGGENYVFAFGGIFP